MISLRTASATLPPLRRNGLSLSQAGARLSRPRLSSVSRLAALAFSVGLAALSVQTAQAQTTVTLPFDTDFEADEGYSVGPLTSDALWQFENWTADDSLYSKARIDSDAIFREVCRRFQFRFSKISGMKKLI